MKTAFLNVILQEKVYVEQSKGFTNHVEQSKGFTNHLFSDHMYMLKKVIYGLK